MKLYFKYRPAHGNLGQGRYTLSYMYNLDREWYVKNGVQIKDLEVPDEKYLDSAKGKLFGWAEFDEAVVSSSDLAFDLDHCYVAYGVKILTNEEAKAFLRTYTDCVESEQGFLTVPAHKNMEGVDVPDKFITIE